MGRVLDSLKNGGREIAEGVRQDILDRRAYEHDLVRIDEREENIVVAATAMLDAGLSDDTVMSMLQKHWDLRPSEAKPFLEWGRTKLEG